jgi:hypothetical protein
LDVNNGMAYYLQELEGCNFFGHHPVIYQHNSNKSGGDDPDEAGRARVYHSPLMGLTQEYTMTEKGSQLQDAFSTE